MKLEHLAHHILERAGDRSRYLVAIAGPPGAGKSTLADQLLSQLSSQGAAGRIVAMDGFHLDNSILTTRGLLERKGAPETFDAHGFLHLIKRLASGEDNVVIPTFDRQRDTAVAGADCVTLKHKILLVEGNYLLLGLDPWSHLLDIWDETLFLNPGLDVLQQRLVERWLELGFSREKALKKAMGNDIPNARYVLEHSAKASIDFST
jgi:pantothenate kinase